MKKIISISFFLVSFMFFGLCSFLFATKVQAEIVSPDLTVTAITFSGSQKGETGKLAVTIKNLGDDLNNTAGLLNVYNNFSSQNFILSSSTPSFLNFKTDRDLPDPSTNNPLKTNEVITFYWYGSFNTSGNLYLEYVVDNANELAESDEENNSYSEVITIENIKQPDIVGDFVSVREGGNENKTLSRIPEVGEKFYLWLVYKNIGDIKTDNTDFNIDVYVDDIFSKKLKASNIDIMANLGVGMYIDDKIELALEEGLHEIKFVLDSDNNIQESNETINVFIWWLIISV
ncbi:MAG: hypothetical protein PF488_00335, partial [Patescibacteria group bacterium]|nr:hypothetical protein [Patescibacteria group bacterium]